MSALDHAPNPAGPQVVGARIKRLREIRNVTRDELSRRSGVSKTTILRLERGLPTRRRTLAKLAKTLRLRPEHLMLPEEDWNRPYYVHHQGDESWYPAATIKPRKDGLPLDLTEADERNRLGHLGYFGTFVHPINCMILQANLGAAVAEIYSDAPKLTRHPGLEFLYVTRGEMVLTIGEDEVYLREGEAITFWAQEPHNYRAAKPVGRHETPPQCLVVVLEGADREG